MANYSIYTLGESQITISNGAVLSGFTQGDGSHLLGQTITLNSNAWTVIDIADGGTDTNFSDTDSDQVLNGAQTIYGVSYASGLRIEAEYTLTVMDPSGNLYTVIGVNINEPGYTPVYGTIEGLAFIGTFPPQNTPLTVVATAEGPPNSGGGSTPSGTYATPPCFVRGTLIDTCQGPRPVQALRPGDRIKVLDGGPQPLRMNLSTTLDAAETRRRPELRPVPSRPMRWARGCRPAASPSRHGTVCCSRGGRRSYTSAKTRCWSPPNTWSTAGRSAGRPPPARWPTTTWSSTPTRSSAPAVCAAKASILAPRRCAACQL